MKKNLANRASILRHKFFSLRFSFVLVFSISLLCSIEIFASNVERVSLLQLSPLEANFKFSSFHGVWFSTQEDVNRFWKENSRNEGGDAPTLPVDWDKESVLGIFWVSKDTVVRLPSFRGSRNIDSTSVEGAKLQLNFDLNTPCAGIVTDQSPSAFIVLGREIRNVNSVSVRTEVTRSLGCY